MKTMFMAKKHEATRPNMLLAQAKGSFVWPCCMTGACVPTLSWQINLKKQFNQTRVGKTAKITNNC